MSENTPEFPNNLFDMLGENNADESVREPGIPGLSGDEGELRGRGTGDGEPLGEEPSAVDSPVGVFSGGTGGSLPRPVGAAEVGADTGTGASSEDSFDATVAGDDGGLTSGSNPGADTRTVADSSAVDSGGAEGGLDRPGTHQSGGLNFQPGTQIHVPSGPKARAEANIAAIEVIRRLESEGWRAATEDEQRVLAQYSSWGAVGKIFENRDDWAELNGRLRALLSEQEYREAAMTTMNAHYTDPAIAQAMWQVLEHAGFEDGVVLEPGCGSGNFIGQAPQKAQMVGVELDAMSAKIASALYPQATIRSEGYEKTRIPAQSLSATIGNVPFGDIPITDRIDNREDLRIHNYFIHKSMKNMPEGAYGVFLTSSWTMDGKKSKAREIIAEHSDLVGAVRLPSHAFSRVAGTSAQADILILRRRAEGEPVSKEQLDLWVRGNTQTHEINGELHEIATSTYFEQNPQMILGEVEPALSGFPAHPILKVTSNDDSAALAAKVRQSLNAQVDAVAEQLPFAPQVAQKDVSPFAPGGYVVPVAADTSGAFAGTLRSVENEVALEVLDLDGQWQSVQMPRNSAVAKEQYELVRLKEAIRAVVESDGAVDDLAVLNERYDNYVETYGPINRFTIRPGRVPSEKVIQSRVAKELSKWQNSHAEVPKAERSSLIPDEELETAWREEASAPSADVKIQKHLGFLRRDPDFGKLLALEVFDEAEQIAKKSGYFEEGTFQHSLQTRHAETASEALAISLEETRTVDLARVGELLGVDESAAREALGELVFDDPLSDELIPAVKYLSGDVRQKHRDAQIAALAEPAYEVNVQRLEEVLPPWASLNTVAVQPGVQFITAGEYEEFIRDTFGVDSTVSYSGGSWSIEGISKANLSVGDKYDFGTSRRDPIELLKKKMNNSPVTVNDTEETSDGKKRSVPNIAETTLARAKQDALVAKFVSWVNADPERVERIERRYNDQVNSYVAPDYTNLAADLQLVGLNENITPHPYQREAVARICHEPTVLLDHVVGAGKTGTMIMSAMELRRTGVAQKPWIVVPNHLVDQVTREFAQWYPASNVLPIPTGLSADERRYYGALSASGDWDAVIVPQSVFSQISVSPRRQRAWLEEQIDELNTELSEAGDSKVRVKQIQGSIKRLENRYEKLQEGKTTGLTFEETGCDYLFVDEAHHYKNLHRNSEYSELSCAGSNKAMDMDFILRALREVKMERAVAEGRDAGYVPSVATFATGTPVANTLAEMWVMGHYLRPDLMEHYGIETIDAFASVFTKAENSVEVKPSGVGFRVKNSISLFTNMDQLMGLAAAYTSTVTREQIPQKLPEVIDDGMRAVSRPASEQVKAYVDDLVQRIENPGPDEYTIQLLGYARKVALDPRMMGLDADEDGGRPALVAEEIMRIHEKNQGATYTDILGEQSPTTGGLQIVFCDQGTPGGAGFNMYKAISDELVARGMDESKIAFIHDARTDAERTALFARCRNGEVNVLIGSTEKMGTGMNVQTRALAIHHVDMPWRPADLDQREGRAIRQGNQNDEVEILSYVTQNTFDAYMMQKLVTKSKALSQLKNHAMGNVMEDIGEVTMSYQEIMAVASGDPRVGEWIELSNSVQRLQTLKMAHESSAGAARFQLSTSEQQLQAKLTAAQALEEFQELAPGRGDVFYVGGQSFLTRNDVAGEAMLDQLRKAYIRSSRSGEPVLVGRAGNVLFTAHAERGSSKLFVSLAHAGTGEPIPAVGFQLVSEDLLGTAVSGRGTVTKMWNMSQSMGTVAARMRAQSGTLQEQVDSLRQVLDSSGGFEQQEELDELMMRKDFLRQELGIDDVDELDLAPAVVDDGFLTDKQMGQVFSAITSFSDLRVGDVVNVSKGNGEITTGFYDVVYERIHQDAQEQLLWKNQETDELFRPYYSVEWELAKRSRESLNDFEQAIISVTERDEVVRSRDLDSVLENLEPGTRVLVQDEERDAEGEVIPRSYVDKRFVMRSGEVVSVIPGTDLIELLTDEGQTLEVEPQSVGDSAGLIMLGTVDLEEKARKEQEKEAEIEENHSRWFSTRLYPGDVLGEDVAEVGSAGDIFVQNQFADPQTGIAEHYLSYHGFKGTVLRGRDLSGEEVKKLFGDSLESVVVSDLRAGDVVDGQRLNPKETRRGPVRIVSAGNFGARKEVKYRPVDAEPWEPVTECSRMESTNVGAVSARRFGALNRHEMMALAATASETATVVQLDNALVGQWVSLETGEHRINYRSVYLGETVEGVVKSISHRHPQGEPSYTSSTDVVLDIDGVERSLHLDNSMSLRALIFTGGYPEGGIDMRGIDVGSALAKVEQNQGVPDALVRLSQTAPTVPMGLIEVSAEREEPVEQVYEPSQVQAEEPQVQSPVVSEAERVLFENSLLDRAVTEASEQEPEIIVVTEDEEAVEVEEKVETSDGLDELLAEQGVGFEKMQLFEVPSGQELVGRVGIFPAPSSEFSGQPVVGQIVSAEHFVDGEHRGLRLDAIIDGAQTRVRYLHPDIARDDVYMYVLDELPAEGLDVTGEGPKMYQVELVQDAEPIALAPSEAEVEGLVEPETTAEQEVSEPEYTAEPEELSVTSSVSAAEVEEITDGIATVEDSQVRSADESRASDEEARGIARTALESAGRSGSVRRVGVDNLVVGDVVFIEHMDDGLITMPESMFDVKSAKVNNPLLPEKFAMPMAFSYLRTSAEGVVLRAEIAEREVEVTAVPTDDEHTFEVLSDSKASMYSRMFTHHRADTERLLQWATLQPREIQVGDRISAPDVQFKDIFGTEVAHDALDDALVLSVEPSREGVELKVQDAEGVKYARLGYRQRAHVDYLSDNDSYAQAQAVLYEADGLAEITDPEVGQIVIASGTDAVTGDEVSVLAEVAQVLDDEGVSEAVLRDSHGMERSLVPGTESLLGVVPGESVETESSVTNEPVAHDIEQSVMDRWGQVPYVNTQRDSLEVSGDGLIPMTVAQVRAGDLVQVGSAEPLPVYQVGRGADNDVTVMVLHPERGLCEGHFLSDTVVEVQPYPASVQMSYRSVERELQRVRPGDIVETAEGDVRVDSIARETDGRIDLTGMRAGSLVQYSGDSADIVPVRYPLCEQARAGIRGQSVTRLVADVQAGDQLKTKRGPAVVNSVEPGEDGSVRVNYQLYGQGHSPQMSLEKDAHSPVVVFENSHTVSAPQSARSSAVSVSSVEVERQMQTRSAHDAAEMD